MNKVDVNLRILFLFFALYFPSISMAAASGHVNYADPGYIMAEVSKRSPRSVVSELYAQPETWYMVLQNIATGSESWLRVAVALRAGSDAGASEMLTRSVGEALENSPESVFLIALPEFNLESICGPPDIDDVRYDTYERAMQALKNRQSRILAIKNPELVNISKQCDHFLEQSKNNVERFFGK